MQVIALLALFFGFTVQMIPAGQPFFAAVFGIVCGVVACFCGVVSAQGIRKPRWTGWAIAALGLALGVWCGIMSPSAYRYEHRHNETPNMMIGRAENFGN
jgi:hypothetical protein